MQVRKDVREEREAIEKFGLNYREGEDGPGLGKDRLRYGSNSGYQAINLAYLMGAKRILLLGYDMGHSDKRHFFGEHPKAIRASTDYRQFIPGFSALARDLDKEGVSVINCSRQTALTCFPRGNINAQ
jgi:hypothetical protein